MRPTTSLDWLDDGSSRMLALVAALPDDQWSEPTLLPGWDRTTLLGHLALNARALSRLVSWARTGVETPMYASAEQRAADIARLGRAPVTEVRQAFLAADAGLRRDLSLIDGPQWTNLVRTARGRPIPASEIPWMRNREVWVHTVDLDLGFGFQDMPAAVLTALLDDAASLMSVRPGALPVLARAGDSGGVWAFGPVDRNPVEVRGSLVDLCRWALGRGQSGAWPVLPAWL